MTIGIHWTVFAFLGVWILAAIVGAVRNASERSAGPPRTLETTPRPSNAPPDRRAAPSFLSAAPVMQPPRTRSVPTLPGTELVRAGMDAFAATGQLIGRIRTVTDASAEVQRTGETDTVVYAPSELDLDRSVRPLREPGYPTTGDPLYRRDGTYLGRAVDASTSIIALDGSVCGSTGEPIVEVYRSDLSKSPELLRGPRGISATPLRPGMLAFGLSGSALGRIVAVTTSSVDVTSADLAEQGRRRGFAHAEVDERATLEPFLSPHYPTVGDPVYDRTTGELQGLLVDASSSILRLDGSVMANGAPVVETFRSEIESRVV